MNVPSGYLIALGALVILVLIAVLLGEGNGCGCTEEPSPIIMGIDAGPGEDEINRRLDATIQQHVAHIEQIEEKFEDDMAAFDARQRAEYERLRGGDDLEAAALFLGDWNRRRHTPTSGGESP